jgi:hypothetical protein
LACLAPKLVGPNYQGVETSFFGSNLSPVQLPNSHVTIVDQYFSIPTQQAWPAWPVFPKMIQPSSTKFVDSFQEDSVGNFALFF